MSDTTTSPPHAPLHGVWATVAAFLGEVARPVAIIALAIGVTVAIARSFDATLVGTAGAVLCALCGIKGAENSFVSWNAGKVQTAAVSKSEVAAQTIATAVATATTPTGASAAPPAGAQT